MKSAYYQRAEVHVINISHKQYAYYLESCLGMKECDYSRYENRIQARLASQWIPLNRHCCRKQLCPNPIIWKL